MSSGEENRTSEKTEMRCREVRGQPGESSISGPGEERLVKRKDVPCDECCWEAR